MQTNGPRHWAASSLALIGADIFAASLNNGEIFRSTDEGRSWIKASSGILDSINVVTTLAANGNNLFAATVRNGIFLSNDEGASWEQLNKSVITGEDSNPLYSDGSVLYEAFGNQIYRSLDTGKTWNVENLGFPYTVIEGKNTYTFFPAIQSFVSSGTALLAGTDRGIFLSNDSGASWSRTNLQDIQINALASDGPNLIAGVTFGIYFSVDHGATWVQDTTSGLPNFGIGVNPVAANGVNLFAWTMRGLLRTTNKGASWTNMNLNETAVSAIVIGDSNLYCSGIDGGIYRSTDEGINWQLADFGLATGPLNYDVNVLAVKDSILFAGCTTYGVSRSVDSGSIWTAVNFGIGNNEIRGFAQNDSDIFINPIFGIFRSRDDGLTWSQLASTLTVNCVLAYGPYLLTGLEGPADSCIFRSSNGGNSWTKSQIRSSVDCIVANSSNVFAGTVDSGIFVSRDSGATWQQANNGLPYASYVHALTTHDTLLVAGTWGGIYVSGDNGNSWRGANVGLKDKRTWSLLSAGKYLFAGSVSQGIFLSTNDGANWKPIGLAIDEIESMAVFGSRLFAVPIALGLWSRSLSEIDTLGENAVDLASPPNPSFTTYPNPFSNRTTINFTSTESGVVEISVVNILGAEVARLFSGELAAGAHSYSWDALGMPAGSYFCILRSSRGVRELPIALVK